MPLVFVTMATRGNFFHRRTVRLLTDDHINVDALSLAKSLDDFKDDIRRIVPLYGGKCYDITLSTAEAALKLAERGLDYEEAHRPLKLLGQKTLHISVFVSVEFPDDELLDILRTYGTLKSTTVRRLHFKETGYEHIENGIRVIEFTQIDRDIPRRIVTKGIAIGFKYTGQPVVCFKCGAGDHLVKACPQRLPRIPLRHQQPQP